jgi:exonuclease VII large subunit
MVDSREKDVIPMATEPDDLNDLLDLNSDDTPAVAEVSSVDELLDSAMETAPAPEAPVVEVPAVEASAEDVETPEQKTIRELREQLAAKPAEAPARKRAPRRPKPESQLTPEEKQIRDLQDQLAKKRAAEIEAAEDVYEEDEAGDGVLIHFLEDGLTFAGRVWYKGQEANFPLNGEAYEQTKDITGKSWLDVAGDDYAQVELYGRVLFRKGPWPGRKLAPTEISGEERLRRNSVPVL